mmetsp:Transcript_46783/g.74633  ORF Transcript_46783/g.74633 Transcript_46783/m.74633 type:complete len:706 (+) Transcript_46783:80-2197(+)
MPIASLAVLSIFSVFVSSLAGPTRLSYSSKIWRDVTKHLSVAQTNASVHQRHNRARDEDPMAEPSVWGFDDEAESDMFKNRSIWNNTWVNFTVWHPAGLSSNVHKGKVVWANVGFMDPRRLFKLLLLAYPGALIPLALTAAIVVGLHLELRDGTASDSGQPIVRISDLTEYSRLLYTAWSWFCHAIPAMMVLGVPIALVCLSYSLPQEVFTITLMVASAFVFFNGLYMILFSPFALAKLSYNMGLSAAEILCNVSCDEQQSVRHWVIFPNYKEDVDILAAAIASVAKSTLAEAQIGILLAMEQREGKSGEEKVEELKRQFDSRFLTIEATYHPPGLPNDPPGKASNVAYAFKWLSQHLEECGHDSAKVLLTIADADTEFHERYFEMLTSTYFENSAERRCDLIWQSPVLHLKNYHRQPGPVLVGTVFTAMSEISCLSDPNSVKFPYSSYSLTAALANEVGGWDAEWIAEDWHMGIKCFLMTLGRCQVQPVLLPTINYTPEAETWLGTVQARFTQAQRHALGFSDLVYYFMMLPLILTHLHTLKRPGAGLEAFWKLFFSGIPHLIKFVNVHVVVGIMSLYALLDTVLKKIMLVILGHSISELFDRTFFANTTFAVASIFLTVVLTIVFQVLYMIVCGRLEKPAAHWKFVFDNTLVHCAMALLCFVLCSPVFCIALGYSVWMAAIQLLRTRTFTYEIASKPTKEMRC